MVGGPNPAPSGIEPESEPLSQSAAHVRLAEPRDLGRLIEIENTCFAGDRLSKRCMRDHLYRANSELIVAVDESDTPHGYALLAFRARARMARLDSLAVLPSRAKAGLGSSLLAHCEMRAHGREVGLRFEVREDNGRAICFYERRGFRRFGEIPDYYEDGQTALLFYKAFGG